MWPPVGSDILPEPIGRPWVRSAADRCLGDGGFSWEKVDLAKEICSALS